MTKFDYAELRSAFPLTADLMVSNPATPRWSACNLTFRNIVIHEGYTADRKRGTHPRENHESL